MKCSWKKQIEVDCWGRDIANRGHRDGDHYIDLRRIRSCWQKAMVDDEMKVRERGHPTNEGWRIHRRQ